MFPSRSSLTLSVAVLALGLTGSALLARPMGWGGPGWGEGPYRSASEASPHDGLEGRILIARFKDEGAALAQGAIAVVPMTGEDETGDPHLAAMFEAAVEDALLHNGYAAAPATASGGQLAEVRVTRHEARPAEAPHKPLSGSVTMGVSNRGSMMGVAMQYDATKPRQALLATRLEARIRDRASGRVLWEGRAEIYTRAGDEHWGDQAIATRLAQILFAGFPNRTGEEEARR